MKHITTTILIVLSFVGNAQTNCAFTNIPQVTFNSSYIMISSNDAIPQYGSNTFKVILNGDYYVSIFKSLDRTINLTYQIDKAKSCQCNYANGKVKDVSFYIFNDNGQKYITIIFDKSGSIERIDEVRYPGGSFGYGDKEKMSLYK